ncbi:formate/nitrite transporter family protein [Haematospirillum sp. H1815]|uniref:formate/nitrite transporter family protein n=1 Tax=Haematospirillum sp. H1815 TaxID=2723108 RepID=UPI00143A9193|nr:formate/nitrite transporter family protein [Haematospirillum sp. H1815]NKD77222.1 formate/nitrite transporter family protein [Haematospirillum sp. H1815]
MNHAVQAVSPTAVNEQTSCVPLSSSYSTPDVLPPDLLARQNEDLAYKKAVNSLSGKMIQGVLAGIFIGVGALFATVVMSGDPHSALPYGVTKMLGGFCFTVGLSLVMLGGGQLFTSDCLITMPVASGRLSFGHMVRSWAVVWCSNFVGAVAFAGLIFLGGQYMQGHGVVGANALYIASAKASLPSGQAFFLGILCNIMVCMAVWMANAGRTVADKIIVIVLPIAGFVAAGGEHCVANMYFIPMGLMIEYGAPDSFWMDIGKLALDSRPHIDVVSALKNLGIVTLANVIGGGVCVGGVYWKLFRSARNRSCG